MQVDGIRWERDFEIINFLPGEKNISTAMLANRISHSGA